MFTNKKLMIEIFSVCLVLMLGMIATIIVFASKIQSVKSSLVYHT